MIVRLELMALSSKILLTLIIMFSYLRPGSGDRLAIFVATLFSFSFWNLIAPVSAIAQNVALRQGIHFYGESTQPAVLGQEYFIFQVRGDEIKGAFFAYQSEFACTRGTVSSQAMNLVVQDPYGEQPDSRFSLALVPQSPLAQRDGNVALTLEGLQEISTIGATEQWILEACF